MLHNLPKFFLLMLAALVIAQPCPALSKSAARKKTPQNISATPSAQPSEQPASQTAQPVLQSDAPPAAAPPPTNPVSTLSTSASFAEAKPQVLVIEIHQSIGDPALYVLRRGLKEAESQHINYVVIDMKTLGGASDAAFEMMEMLKKFPGKTITYVNDEAGSAGAFIAAATDEIWFAPHGTIGAAAAVDQDGKDIGDTMRLKVNSFFSAKVRALTENYRYRGEVITAMMDKDYELIIGGKTIKPKGVLLSLTASEAMKTYGNPPQPILGAGIARDIDELLAQKLGVGNYITTHVEITWSERLAEWLNMFKPILIGLGMLALFIEFKTPGFGIFGITGIVLLGIVFLSSYIAGLSGHEPILLFALGLILVLVELIFFPGVVLPVVTGVLLMLVSLVWAMADLWPDDPISVTWSSDRLLAPALNLVIGLVIATVLILALLRYMPKTWFWDRLVLKGEIAGASQVGGIAPEDAHTLATLVGKHATVVTPLRPFGQVEIDGRRYEARYPLGSAAPGSIVIVRGHTDFALDVEPAPEDQTETKKTA